jgi:agmatine deiminase
MKKLTGCGRSPIIALMKLLEGKSRRLPAEWEEQDGILLAWPHRNSDWEPVLELVEPVFARIISAISRYEKVLLIVPEADAAVKRLAEADTRFDRVSFIEIPTNDTWARDFGPITVYEDEAALLLDYGFNGWGLKFAANHDNRINSALAEKGIFKGSLLTMPIVLEGGSIESDGKGTLLVTSECLLNRNRNPHLSQKSIESALSAQLGADRFLWLNHGYLAGDDTDSHIDTLARLCPKDTILYVSCSDPADEHFKALSAMKAELESFRTRSGSQYRLIPLPLPTECRDENAERIPATYANFLIINGAVLVPTYNCADDEAALASVGEAFPGRKLIGIDCSSIILQHGSLHCLTMQLPKGTLA